MGEMIYAEFTVALFLLFLVLYIIFDWIFSYKKYKDYDKLFSEMKDLSERSKLWEEKVDISIFTISLSFIKNLIEKQLAEISNNSPSLNVRYLNEAKKEIDNLINKLH